MPQSLRRRHTIHQTSNTAANSVVSLFNRKISLPRKILNWSTNRRHETDPETPSSDVSRSRPRPSSTISILRPSTSEAPRPSIDELTAYTSAIPVDRAASIDFARPLPLNAVGASYFPMADMNTDNQAITIAVDRESSIDYPRPLPLNAGGPSYYPMADLNTENQRTVENAPVPELAPAYDAAPEGSDSTDPLHLRNGYKDGDEIQMMRIRGNKLKFMRMGDQVAAYHEKQNQLISSFLKPLEEYTIEAEEEENAAKLPVQIAIYGSMLANFSLCVLQMYAAISGLSLSLLATGIDSVFDLGSNILLWYLHRKASRLDVNRWPVGGARLETIGNIVYGFLMGSVNLVVIVESVQSIVSHKPGDRNEFHLPSIISVGAALFVKLVLFLYCYSIRKHSSQVQVLWEDHRNDLWINTFGLLTSTGGSKLGWWLDPGGAIIIGLGIVISWSRTIYNQFCLLAGKTAPHELLQLLVYKTMTYSHDIEKVDTVRAYHSGPSYFVEIDIVMNAETPLWRAHDLGQRLQDDIEIFPNVERAFVHVDYETTHTPEHRKAQ